MSKSETKQSIQKLLGANCREEGLRFRILEILHTKAENGIFYGSMEDSTSMTE